MRKGASFGGMQSGGIYNDLCPSCHKEFFRRAYRNNTNYLYMHWNKRGTIFVCDPINNQKRRRMSSDKFNQLYNN